MNQDREKTFSGSQTAGSLAGSSNRELWLWNKLNEARKLLPMQSEITGDLNQSTEQAMVTVQGMAEQRFSNVYN